MSDATNWTQAEAIELCCKVESICPQFGYHVALTGGCLYKDGPRKDCDIVFYRIRQVNEPRTDEMFAALERTIELKKVSGFGFVIKALYKGKGLDCFFPEEVVGEYQPESVRTVDPMLNVEICPPIL